MKSVFGLLFSLVMMISIQADWKNQINLTEAQSIFLGSSNIQIAIFDNGVYPHPYYYNRINYYGNYDYNGDIKAPYYTYPNFEHGTKMTGIVAQVNRISPLFSYNCAENPPSVNLGPEYRILNRFLFDIANSEIDIVNMSFGKTPNNGSMILLNTETAINITKCFNNNKILIAGSGNNNKSYIHYPALINEVISVGTIDENNDRWERSSSVGSSYGTNLDFVAPGGYSDIRTTSLEFDHLEEEIHTDPESGQSWIVTSYYFNPIMDYTGGTSSATAIVSGIASLIKGYYLDNYNIELSNLEIMNILKYSASDLNTPGYDIETGWGCPNAHKALEVLNDNVIRIVQHIPNPSSGS